MRETARIRSTVADGCHKLRQQQPPSESVAALRVPSDAPSALPGRAGLLPSNESSLAKALTEKRVGWGAKEREILDVASMHFLEHGYRGASVNGMVRSSGISKESIYRYFSSKRDLLAAVIERELAESHATLRWRVAVLHSMDLRAALTTIATTFLRTALTDRALALQRLVFEEAKRSPAIGRRYHNVRFGRVYGALKQVFLSSAVASEFDAGALSRHFVAMLTWRITLERECAVRAAPTTAEAETLAAAAVDDFAKAFLRSQS
jgi:AcrR family transcriptional regulator